METSIKLRNIHWSSLKVPFVLMLAFWMIGLLMVKITGNWFYLFNFPYIGTAIGLGLGLYSLLPRRKKHWGRRTAKLMIGSYMLGYLGFVAHENMQIEGFFFYLLAGIFSGSTIHYLVAKITGPLLFGRGWCGWACWTSMLMDLLPWKANLPGRLPRQWGAIRYLHFALSLALVLVVSFALSRGDLKGSIQPIVWLVAGNLFYYASAFVLAWALKDNRAF